MANPVNVVNVAKLFGKNKTTRPSVTNALVDIMPEVLSNYVHKVNQIIVTNNETSTNNCDVRIAIEFNGTVRYLAYDITIPYRASLSLLDTPLYLSYDSSAGVGEKLQGAVQTPNEIDIVVSWEEISDVA